MDGFGGDNFDQADVDPAAEFLAREKDQLAGLVDDVIPPANESGTGDDANANSGELQLQCNFQSKICLRYCNNYYIELSFLKC